MTAKELSVGGNEQQGKPEGHSPSARAFLRQLRHYAGLGRQTAMDDSLNLIKCTDADRLQHEDFGI